MYRPKKAKNQVLEPHVDANKGEVGRVGPLKVKGTPSRKRKTLNGEDKCGDSNAEDQVSGARADKDHSNWGGTSGGNSKQKRGRQRNTKMNEKECSHGVQVEEETTEDSSGKSNFHQPYGLRHLKVSAQPEEPKAKKRNIKFTEEECFMCHQCQRNDKGEVVRCTNCKRKRFCIPCIKNWYPLLKPEDIAKACPVCCGNCNCIACLRSDELIKKMKFDNDNVEINGNTHERVELLKYLLQGLLPFLRQLDKEQLIEELEAKKQGLSPLELDVEKEDLDEDERGN